MSIGSVAHAAVDGVGCGAEAGGQGAEEHVGFAEEFFVPPFGFFVAVDFAAFGGCDVFPDGVEELPFPVLVVATESISHDVRVALLSP